MKKKSKYYLFHLLLQIKILIKLVENAVESAKSDDDLDIVTNLVENSKGTLSNKVLDSANNNEATKKKVSEVIVKIVEKNPEKAVAIIEKIKTPIP